MADLHRTLVIRGRRFRLKVEDSNRSSDYQKYEDLRHAVWGFPEDNLAAPRNMMCENFLHEGSSLFIAAYEEDDAGRIEETPDRLLGFAYGFVGVKDKTVAYKSIDNLWFYSQYTAVRPEVRGAGLGFRIKEFQRDLLKEIFGIYTVVCTFDPLTGVNAERNIHHFGMDIEEYRVAPYGEYGGLLNRTDVPSDRFFMAWDLRREPQRPEPAAEYWLASGARVIENEERRVAGRTGLVDLEIVRGFHPAPDRTVLLVQIPGDFYLMLRETDVDDPDVRKIPLEWRLLTRTAFRMLFAQGYRVADFISAPVSGSGNYYVLTK